MVQSEAQQTQTAQQFSSFSRRPDSLVLARFKICHGDWERMEFLFICWYTRLSVRVLVAFEARVISVLLLSLKTSIYLPGPGTSKAVFSHRSSRTTIVTLNRNPLHSNTARNMRSLPHEVWAEVGGFLAPVDLYHFRRTCQTFRKVVTAVTIVKSVGAGSRCSDDFIWTLNVFICCIKSGKILMPSPTRWLRIVLNANGANRDSHNICCDFCPETEARYFSSTRGLVLCCRQCPLQPHSTSEEKCYTTLVDFTEMASDTQRFLMSHPLSASYIEWWRLKGYIYTSLQPAHDSVTGERCGCPLSMAEIRSMEDHPWSFEKLQATLPGNDPQAMEELNDALLYANDYLPQEKAYKYLQKTSIPS